MTDSLSRVGVAPRFGVRWFVLAAAVTVAAILSATARAADPSPTAGLFISGPTVIDVRTGRTRVSDILVRDGRIVDVSEKGAKRAPEGAQVVDATGRYAIPGLWDMHMHLTVVPEMQDREGILLLANGVTSVRDTGGGLPATVAVRERGKDAAIPGPRVRIAGPIIDGSPPVHEGSEPGSSRTADTPEQAIQYVDEQAARGVDFIKSYEMLRPEVFTAVVKRAHEHHLLVTGHVPIRMTTEQTLAAGFDGVEHIRGMEFDCAKDPQKLLAQRTKIMDDNAKGDGAAVRRMVHATVRPVAFAEQDPARCAELIKLFVKKGTWHTPTLHIVAFRALRNYEKPKWKDALRYLPDSLRPVWQARLADYTDPSKYLEWETQGNWAIDAIGQMHKAGVRLLAGTDAPGLVFMPGFTLHDELAALVRAGLPALAALQAATMNPAHFFKMDKELGTVQRGKLADIVLLDADPLADIANAQRISAVISKGRLYDRAALDALLAPFDSSVKQPERSSTK